MSVRRIGLAAVLWLVLNGNTRFVNGGDLEIRVDSRLQIALIGAIQRWDGDGNASHPVDPNAKIDVPRVDARATRQAASRWVFTDLPAGRYDLVILADPRVRIEGFAYPPVLEFDAFMQHKPGLDQAARTAIETDIAQSRHYENKVAPLYMSGDGKHVRVLVQLRRDKNTSYDAQYGKPVATVRHEVWQYTNQYGAWTKEKRTRVLDRLLMGRAELRQWTWVWTPKIGGIVVPQRGRVTLDYALPSRFPTASERGLTPSS